MLTSQAVARELPRLRRYGRALTGNQTSGDAYVTATLEALAEDPSSLNVDDDIAIGLFSAFTRIWNSVELNTSASAGGLIDEHIRGMTPLPRQAFLLVALEDFAEPAAAKILDVPVIEDPQLAVPAARSMQNSNWNPESRAARAAVVVDNVTGLHLSNVGVSWPSDPGVPMNGLFLRHVHEAVVNSPHLRPSQPDLAPIINWDDRHS